MLGLQTELSTRELCCLRCHAIVGLLLSWVSYCFGPRLEVLELNLCVLEVDHEVFYLGRVVYVFGRAVCDSGRVICKTEYGSFSLERLCCHHPPHSTCHRPTSISLVAIRKPHSKSNPNTPNVIGNVPKTLSIMYATSDGVRSQGRRVMFEGMIGGEGRVVAVAVVMHCVGVVLATDSLFQEGEGGVVQRVGLHRRLHRCGGHSKTQKALEAGEGLNVWKRCGWE
ncbi:uncharacterized protein HKW66_Vig0179340 [Vigna angularis]|uniref:Uncharacterized protein n=1 Tax=Phaseolus angularis TaxID=3914 RepID=A0A8T0JYB4_PHAAN|nr:uncharacterized protein HKW66_Vig0179340 [Vigna angularis]